MRRADPNPAYCSVCYQPPNVKEGMGFVDFEVAYDGPVIPGASEPVCIDDLIVCDDCVKAAANLIGFEDGADLRGQISEQRKHIEELEREVRAKDKSIVYLNDTIDATIDFPIKRPGGRSRIIGPDSRKEELATVKASRHKSERRKASSGADSK